MSRFNAIFISIILIFALALSLVGCGAASTPAPSPDKSPINSDGVIDPSPSPSAGETSSPEASPSPSEKIEAPKVDGCTIKVVDGNILYYAEEGNTYGLETGELFGEFVPNVNMVTEGENNVEGGWALNSKVVDKLLIQGSAETGEDLINTKIVLPLDISGLDKDSGVSIFGVSVFRDEVNTGSALLIEFEEENLTFVNGYDNNHDEHVLAGYMEGKLEWDLHKENGETVAFSGYGYTFDSNNNLFYFSEDFSPNGSEGGYFFGDAVINVGSPLMIGSDRLPGIDDIFTFQGLPVFLMAN
ncbi:MAG: hypothetical protein Q8O09_01260, partial [Bacillota bacterium]|nr:hypothetical protein [Bacillota bacterium]